MNDVRNKCKINVDTLSDKYRTFNMSGNFNILLKI